ncbi:MAG: hypothetical protein IKP64_01900 [Selenomonadaceae bacterium]|nr:hypothetical protein [Selenomonadaceae bacterium]MBR4382289.1 hypothetical protein [Selenomonadaceae bacterium]
MGQRQRSSEPYFRKIDFVFYNESKIRLAIAEMRLDDGRPHLPSNGISNPTMMQAIRNLTPLAKVSLGNGHDIEFPERWLEVIDKTWSWAKAQPDCRAEVARRRYAKEDYRKTCHELNISNSTRRRLFDFVRMYAALHAVQLGLIRV